MMALRVPCRVALLCLCCLAGGNGLAGDDPHYTGAGFFDIHVCNWPDRPLFMMPLFSTERFDEIERIDVFGPDNTFITQLDLKQFRILKRKGKPDKRVFIRQIDMPAHARDGWYSASVTLTDGSEFRAQDYLILSQLPQVFYDTVFPLQQPLLSDLELEHRCAQSKHLQRLDKALHKAVFF